MSLILKSPAAHPSSPCAFCAPGDAAGPDDTVRMELPKLSPGKRFTLPRPLGSADSLLLARLAGLAARVKMRPTWKRLYEIEGLTKWT